MANSKNGAVANLDLEKKIFKPENFSFKLDQEGEGVVEAYVSIFGNTDLGGEVVEPGAFTESLARKLPKGVWSHNWEEPIAKTLEAREDEKGLYIKGQLVLGVQKAKEAYELLKSGVIDEFSIGYKVDEDQVDEKGIRHLKKLSLYEWSPVLVGMNPATEVLSIKAVASPAEGEKAPVEESPAEEKEKTETLPEADFIPEPEPEEEEVKEGRVLSGKNQALIEDVIGQMELLAKQLKNTLTPLKELVNATSDPGEKVDASPEETKKFLRIRQVAKQIDKANEYILKITK